MVVGVAALSDRTLDGGLLAGAFMWFMSLPSKNLWGRRSGWLALCGDAAVSAVDEGRFRTCAPKDM